MMRISFFVLLSVFIAPEQDAARGIYKTSLDINAELAKAGQVSRTGAAVSIVNRPQYHAVVRRRSSSDTPQNAIVHPASTEIYQIVDGGGMLVTGGTLDPPPGNATVQTANNVTSTGIKGGEGRHVSRGDVIVVPAGTPHWFSKIDGAVTYLEVQFELK